MTMPEQPPRHSPKGNPSAATTATHTHTAHRPMSLIDLSARDITIAVLLDEHR
jgi:hypothetical protein